MDSVRELTARLEAAETEMQTLERLGAEFGLPLEKQRLAATAKIAALKKQIRTAAAELERKIEQSGMATVEAEIFRRRYVASESFKAIAAAVGCSASNVYRYHAQARRKYQQHWS